MKMIKFLCFAVLSVLLPVVLVSCSSKDESKAAADFNLKLINTIELDEIIEEVPLWEVAEDRIFLNCPQEIVIKSIDFEGDILNELTTVGMGPGEIKQFDFPFIDSHKKEFFYVEWSQSKIVYYDYELNFLRNEERGMNQFQYYRSFPEKEVSLRSGLAIKDKKMVSDLTASITTADTTIVIAESEHDISNYDFTTEFRIASNGKIVAQSTTSTGDINFNIFDMAGNKLREVLFSQPQVSRDEEYIEALKERNKNGGNFRNFKYESAITEMAIDNKNRIWVNTWDLEHQMKLLVFSESGELVQDFSFEDGIIQVKILDDKLFMLILTEESNILEIYQIEG